MNNLSNNIYNYYIENFETLPLDKQLHFATRLWLWRHDAKCHELIEELRGNILPTINVVDSLRSIKAGELLPIRPGSQNVLHLRQPYFEQYPLLRSSATVLYWACLLDSCYQTDAHAVLDKIVALDALAALNTALLADRAAVAILSTHAVNFLYLYNRYVRSDTRALDTTFFSSIAADSSLYDFTDPLQTQLQIYLLTHTIIADSLFYSQPLATEKITDYQQISRTIEAIIQTNFSAVNLDNKLEFLVCCRLTQYETKLEAAILAEAEQSVSPDGIFLIDRNNTNKQAAYTSFDKSEHRSVLYLMATAPRA